MERHANNKNAPETIKVPLQGLSKSGKTIFAYMRRSTTKKEQASSLPQQEEGIEIIANSLGVNISEIHAFTESRSGYENRTRPEWNKMLEQIDSLKEPCVIFCRDTSRLSRNPTDNLAIANRMFGDNRQKKVIGNIFFLGNGMKIEEWNERTNKKYIVETLHQNYIDSMENKEKCMGGILLKLDGGEFPYHPPHGLTRVNRDGVPRKSRSEKTTLRQNEKIQFVRHAFEMKAKGRTAQEICKYLKQYAGISISTKNIVETLIGNTVYIGKYTEKTTGTIFENIKFWEGKPPIDPELWERANAKVGKRGYGFGEGQAEHIAPGILKHESGKNLYLYKAKGKYNAYQTEIKSEDGKRKSIGIMESTLVKEFLDEVMPKIRYIWFRNFSILEHLQAKERAKASLEKNSEDDSLSKAYREDIRLFDEIIKTLQNSNSYAEFRESPYSGYISLENYFENQKMSLLGLLDTEKSSLDKEGNEEIRRERDNSRTAVSFLKNGPKIETVEHERSVKKLQIIELEQKKQHLEDEKKNIDKKAFKLGYSADIADEMKQETEKEIQEIQGQIDFLSESTNMEQYLDRLPEILQNLHELSSRVLTETDYAGWRTDIKQLMELVSHELILGNKKELKVKLFEGLENLESGKMGNGATDRTGTCDLLLRREAF